jgi:flagellar biosynthesis chaperone FliJ
MVYEKFYSAVAEMADDLRHTAQAEFEKDVLAKEAKIKSLVERKAALRRELNSLGAAGVDSKDVLAAYDATIARLEKLNLSVEIMAKKMTNAAKERDAQLANLESNRLHRTHGFREKADRISLLERKILDVSRECCEVESTRVQSVEQRVYAMVCAEAAMALKHGVTV